MVDVPVIVIAQYKTMVVQNAPHAYTHFTYYTHITMCISSDDSELISKMILLTFFIANMYEGFPSISGMDDYFRIVNL